MVEKPVFLVSRPTFMGLSGDKDFNQNFLKKYKGERVSTDIQKINSVYVHGKLEQKCGFDISTLVAGHLKREKIQPILVIDHEGIEYDAFFVWSEEKDRAYLVSDPTEANL